MKIAFTGTHGVGKTTSCFELAHRMKLEHQNERVIVICENASHSPYPINKKTTHKSQLWIYTSQLALELEYEAKYDIVICDRTIVDAIAYTAVAGRKALTNAMMLLATQHIRGYDRVIMKLLANNQYQKEDGVRDQDTEFRVKVEEELKKLYGMLSVKVEEE